MPSSTDLLTAGLLSVGHLSLCIWGFNRLHARHWPRWMVYGIDRSAALVTLALFTVYALRWYLTGDLLHGNAAADWIDLVIQFHMLICVAALGIAVPNWLWPRLRPPRLTALAGNHTDVIDLVARLGERPVHGLKARLLASLPRNEILRLHVHVKELRLPRWPQELDGFTIVHLSDLHMLGKLTQPFYDEVFREAAALQGDLVVATGDILENPECLPWIPATFGKLRGRLGQYYILGNHELRLPEIPPLRRALNDAGWSDIGGRSVCLDVDGRAIVLAGDERPWFGAAPVLPPIDAAVAAPPRILMAHTPDLFPWAREQQFDLMLAGHTHGGQIRLPLLGPLFAPSDFGFRYAAGLFHEGPTVMHVTRGISGEHLLRYNCPPELTKLVLRRADSH